MIRELAWKCPPEVFNTIEFMYRNCKEETLFKNIHFFLNMYFYSYKEISALEYAIESRSDKYLLLVILTGEEDLSTQINKYGETPLFAAMNPLPLRKSYKPFLSLPNLCINSFWVELYNIYDLMKINPCWPFGLKKELVFYREWVNQNEVNMVKILLENGADSNIPNKDGVTPLQYALFLGATEIVKLILSNRFTGFVFEENMDIVKFLLDKKDEVIIAGTDFSTLLYFTAKISDETAFRLVLTKCSPLNVNAIGPRLETIIHLLIVMDNKKFIKILLHHGVNLNLRINNCVPLLWAFYYNRKMVEFLLKIGADPNMRGGGYCSHPIDCVALYSDVEDLELLLKYGANVEGARIRYIDDVMFSPLFQACNRGKVKMIEILLEHNADVNATFVNIHTPLEVVLNWPSPNVSFPGARNFVLRLFVTRIALMRAENEYVHKKNIELVTNHELVKDMYIECQNEIKRMRKKGFYNFMKDKNLHKLAVFARNKYIVKIFEEMDLLAEFPMYGSILRKNLERAKSRLNIIDSILIDFNYLIKSNVQPMTFEHICGYLGDKDLENLMDYCLN